MSKIGRAWIAAMFALMLAAQASLADDICDTNEKNLAATNMQKAEGFERAGKLKLAYKSASEADRSLCLPDDRANRMVKRIGLQLGQQDEKQGQLAAAFEWYKNSGNGADADRVMLKQVNTNPRDRSVVSNAIDHFRFTNIDTRVKELRQLAAKNAELELANEEKAFATRKISFDELGLARDWLSLVDKGTDKKVRERAEQRGDTLLKESMYRHLENAKRYFSMAGAKPKEKAVQDKALRLAQEHEKKGEITQAGNFYSLAGASGKGDELEARAKAEHEKSEATRQKKFTREQDDLEKQLGL